jgi:hypothetical protein
MLPSNGQGTGDRESARWQITMPALLLLLVSACSGGLVRRWIPRTGTASPSVPGRSSAVVTSPVMSKAASSSGTSSSTSVWPETPPPLLRCPPPRRIIWSPRRVCEWSNYLAHLDRAIWRYPWSVTTLLRA